MIKLTSKHTNRKSNNTFHDFVKSHMNDFVEVNTYLCGSKLYGTISDFDKLSLTLSVNFLDGDNKYENDRETLYIPLNSIKSIKKL